VREKLLSLARVLAGDHVGFLQDTESAKRNVLEVADGGRDDVEEAFARVFCFGFRVVPGRHIQCRFRGLLSVCRATLFGKAEALRLILMPLGLRLFS